jgi:hypothetical protein
MQSSRIVADDKRADGGRVSWPTYTRATNYKRVLAIHPLVILTARHRPLYTPSHEGYRVNRQAEQETVQF